jgi:hypothetical protein
VGDRAEGIRPVDEANVDVTLVKVSVFVKREQIQDLLHAVLLRSEASLAIAENHCVGAELVEVCRKAGGKELKNMVKKSDRAPVAEEGGVPFFVEKDCK